MSLGTRLFTWLNGNLVGEDEIGNKYYCNSKNFKDLNAKRWVIFNGEIEASKIPPHWHAWLHKSIDMPPINYSHKHKWQKEHKSNMTGTSEAYFPSSHPLSKNYDPDKQEDEYKSWSPN
tara:strand:+ start:225 stop:581 length:357 start_codon:yes stop_codon:yes gene_type:complete